LIDNLLVAIMKLMARTLPFLKKQNPRDAFLVLDIGTKIIKAVIFFVEDEKIIIIGYGKKHHNLENYTKNVRRLADLCKTAISQAQKQSRIQKINGAILGFGGGFIKGETFSQKFFRENFQRTIDISELKNILQKLQWKAREEICHRPEEAASCPPKLLQSWICEARVDGYLVTNPFDFQGKEIMLSVFNSYSSADFFNFLEEFSSFLKLELFGIFDESFAVYQAILRKKIPNFNAIFIDVGGLSTNVSVARKGKFEKSVEFGLGGQNFTELLTRTFGVSELEAEDIKIKYSRGELGYGVGKKIAKIFEKASLLWHKALNLSFEEFSFKRYLPSQIYLFGGGSLLPELRDGLIKKKAKEHLSNLADFKAEILTPSHFKDSVGMVKGIEDYGFPQDTVPLSLALFFSSTLKKESIFEKILKQTLRIIQ